MTKSHSILTKLIWGLVYALPVVLFFSYHPIISLGSSDSMNFELSLPLIWLVIFDIIALIALISVASAAAKAKKSPIGMWGFRELVGISDRRIFLFSLFPFYATISIFWSANPVRAILTAGIIWLLFFAIFALIYILPLLPRPHHFRRKLLATYFLATTAVCLFCFIQSILDTCGLPRSETLLCAGCTYRSFGFPHPSGFAIEPQFMGNLLLVPTFLSLYLIVFPGKNKPVSLYACALLFSTTLFFTFSRGAIYAFGLGFLVLLVLVLKKRLFRPSLLIIPIVAFLCSLGLQGTFAQFGPTSETFLSAVTKSIHHLSLGKIDLRALAQAPEAPSDSEPPSDQAQAESPATEPPEAPDEPFFDGYVAESTNVRLNLNKAAIDTWLSAPGHPESSLTIGLKCAYSDPCLASGRLTPTSLLFGVGLGAAGTALYQNSAITGINSPKEIVQNQFLSILLELGLVGTLLAIFSLLLAFFPKIFPSKFLDGRGPSPVSPPFPATLLAPIIIAFLISLNFFSGLPNALHIYLLPPLLYLVFAQINLKQPQNTTDIR